MAFNVANHVENRRLLLAAAGEVLLSSWERQHLHECETCQAVFNVLLNQPFDAPPESGKDEPAA